MKMTLTWQAGFIDKPLHDVLHLPINPIPEMVWVEPRPFLMENTKLYAPIEFWGLQVLQQDEHDWPQKMLSADIQAEEAYLYWHDRFCHLLDTSKGCRWFYCRENEAECEILAPEFESKERGKITLKREISQKPVIMRQDTHRFSFKPSGLDKSQCFNVVKYWENSALFAWRLLRG